MLVATNDRWNPIDTIYRTTDGGTTWTTVTSTTASYTLGFGAAAPGQRYPTIYQVGDRRVARPEVTGPASAQGGEPR